MSSDENTSAAPNAANPDNKDVIALIDESIAELQDVIRTQERIASLLRQLMYSYQGGQSPPSNINIIVLRTPDGVNRVYERWGNTWDLVDDNFTWGV
jgi:hypothetical protein